jgi:hypothetical protein
MPSSVLTRTTSGVENATRLEWWRQLQQQIGSREWLNLGVMVFGVAHVKLTPVNAKAKAMSRRAS